MTTENNKSETFNTDLRKWGSSKGILVPKLIMEKLNIIEGDEMEVTVSKIEVNEKRYICNICKTIIEGSQVPKDEYLFCPCGNEDMRAFTEIFGDNIPIL